MSDIRSHNLASLCQRCNIDTDSDERATLDKLTRYIEWVGKYPIPLAAEDMLPTRKDNGTWVDGGESFDGHKTQEKLDAIWMRIWNELMQLEKDPGRSNKP